MPHPTIIAQRNARAINARHVATDRDIMAAHISEWTMTRAATIDGAARAWRRAQLAMRAMRDMGDDRDDA